MRSEPGREVREKLDRDRLRRLIVALGESVTTGPACQVYLVGGATAVERGWRPATIEADLSVSDERPLARVQAIKEALRVNIELSSPEQFVPALAGSADRHLFVESVGRVSFFHFDPYMQLLAKIVRGFEHDLLDASRFIDDGLVDVARFLALVREIPDEAYARHPNLSRRMVESAVGDFVRSRKRG